VLGADFTFSQQTTSISVKPVQQHASRRCVSDFIICWYGSSHCVLWRRLVTLLLIWKNLTPALLLKLYDLMATATMLQPSQSCKGFTRGKGAHFIAVAPKEDQSSTRHPGRNNQTLNGEFNPINENHIFC
jgi:hypothetical protein